MGHVIYTKTKILQAGEYSYGVPEVIAKEEGGSALYIGK